MTKLTPEGQAVREYLEYQTCCPPLGNSEYNAIARAAIEASDEVKRLREAIETALQDLECNDVKCWSFTRAAMQREECTCVSCEVWRVLAKAKY